MIDAYAKSGALDRGKAALDALLALAARQVGEGGAGAVGSVRAVQEDVLKGFNALIDANLRSWLVVIYMTLGVSLGVSLEGVQCSD